ncbi:aldehyde dehydrogenase family protein [Niveispirillum fermenti]|uniref:aldehyde dehydrogenase family protein n=1 Tax=Niveispirillum fermenti TaxID=1233113 RepID=UPI003A8A1EF8
MADAVIEFPSALARQRPASAADKRLVAALSHLREGWRREGGIAIDRRAEVLDRLAGTLRHYEASLTEAMAADFGHPPGHVRPDAGIRPSHEAIRNLARLCRRRARHWLPRGGMEWEPLGVVAIITSRNDPVQRALVPVAAAIAAGNRVLLKPSEQAPRTAILLERLLAETFTPSEMAVAGGGADTAQAICQTAVDHVHFTGWAGNGRQVMRAAADNPASVTLELGGKNPVIVTPGYPLALAAAQIAAAKLADAGQTGAAPDHVLLPAGSELDFINHFEKATISLYPSLRRSNYSAIVTDKHYQDLLGMIDDARRWGARAYAIHPGGEGPEPGSRKLAPTLLWPVMEEAEVMSREVHGPLLPLLSYGALDEAVAMVNGRPRPPALYLFSRHEPDVGFVLDRVRAGSIMVNGTQWRDAQGNPVCAGIAAYHGEPGIRRFSQPRMIYRRGPLDGLARLWRRLVR